MRSGLRVVGVSPASAPILSLGDNVEEVYDPCFDQLSYATVAGALGAGSQMHALSPQEAGWHHVRVVVIASDTIGNQPTQLLRVRFVPKTGAGADIIGIMPCNPMVAAYPFDCMLKMARDSVVSVYTETAQQATTTTNILISFKRLFR